MKLELLREADSSSAQELSVAQGWNQTAADWERVLMLEPSGCFAARRADRLIGTVTTTTYGRSLAWLGMMIVHPDFRRQGVGAALMRLALDYLSNLRVQSVQLDATPAGRPLYETLGFVAEAEIERWQGVANHGSTPDSRTSVVEPLKPVFALDQAAYGADRSRMLRSLMADCAGGPLVVRSDGGVPDGYALARAGRAATYIGPVVANTASASRQLIDEMVARFPGRELCLDLHRGGLIEPSVLFEQGLSMRRGLTRMRLAPDAGAGTARRVCASAGPELG